MVSAATIVYSGTNLSRYGDIIAEKTGMGRTWIGVLLMASVTSLPELVTGISSVTQGLADIAAGDVLGSCVFNMVILASLDLVEREKTISARAHHGHVLAAGFGILLLSLISVSLYGGSRLAPLGSVGFYSIFILAIYLFAMRTIFSYEKREFARFIGEQAAEFKYQAVSMRQAAGKFALNALLVIAAAVSLPRIGAGIAQATALGQSFVGNIFIAAATSLPEVVVSLAAARIGAIDLAIGNLLGSNICNIFILAVDDLFFAKGPILGYVNSNHIVSSLAAISMTSIMIIGLTYRSEKKLLFLAWDSMAVILLYLSYLILLYAFR
ncbi:sodium/hydrogen exchanger [Geoanaerobacter pelophilus]|uniref:Sodium/hydrogen exchanger n=2 Tax=Geoanaerobacter pelophilus TaxID=60036 RepID=A0ABQ0MED7_9BACT|nr:sodium/hydrogen exchanger [Geoanaerobacter pelophilus]